MTDKALHSWPFVGRDAEIDTVIGALSDPACAGIVVTGPAGVGKTALVRAATTVAASGAHTASTDADDTTVHWAYASPGAARIPFGALAELLLFSSVDAADPTSYLLAARERLAGGRAILVVDDAPLLDHASVVLVCQLVRAGDVRIVLTVRTGQVLADEFGRLLDDRTVDELAVAPLDFSATTAVVEEALGGPIEPGLGEAVLERSGGNALFIRELVTAGRADGVIAWGRGAWRLDGRLPVSDRLIDAVQRRIAGVEESRLDALRAVAVGSPLPLDAALAIAATDVLTDLESAGLIVTDSVAGRPHARIAHPLVGEAVEAAIVPLERRALVMTLAQVVDADDLSQPDKVLRWAVQRLDAGVAVPAATLSAASAHAFSLLEHPLAERLARAAIAAGDPFEARLALGAALSAQLDVIGGEAALTEAVTSARDDGERARATGRLGLHLAIRAGRIEDGLKVLRAGVESLTDPQWRDFLRADLTKIELMAGETPSGGGAGPRSRDVTTRANECIVGALLGALSGDVVGALAAADEGLELAPQVRSTLPNIVDLVLLGRYLALSFAGDAEAAASLAAEQVDQARQGRPEPLGMWLAVQASTAALVGEPARAIDLATEALPLLIERDFVGGFHPQTTAVLATARAQRGEIGTARSLVTDIDPMWLADSKTALQVALAEAWIDHAEGRSAAGAARAVAASAAALASGLVVLAAIGAHEAVRLGHPEGSIDVLVDAAARAPRTLAGALLRSAQAAADDDPVAIVEAAEGLVSVGCPILASEQLARAGALYRRRSQGKLATRVERRAAQLAPVGELRPTVAVPPPLTNRERQIASLAAARWRTKEIAESLGISPRTVDNTLAKLYRKLEITGRDDLADRLDELGLRTSRD